MKRVAIIACSVIVLSLLCALLYMYRGAVHNLLDTWRLIPHPESFTELYLDDYTGMRQGMPTEIIPGTTIDFSFTVHNLEGKDIVYPYNVYLVDEIGTTTLKSGVITLADKATVSTPITYTFKKQHSNVTVYIQIPTESVHFSIPVKI